MIFEELILEDVGVFQGRQTFDLKPKDEGRPIVLIGGLNGAGKTTIMDAIWLVLYGNRTPAPARAGLPYKDYLRRLIHKNAHPMKGARIELQLSYYEQARPIVLRVVRSFSLMGDRVFEDVQVFEGQSPPTNQPAPNKSLDWPRHVEARMPLALMRMFFFDGADIQRLLRTEESTNFFKEACEEALGLGVTGQLSEDLAALEQKKRRALGSVPGKQIRVELEGMQQMLDSLADQRQTLLQKLAQTRKARAAIQRRLHYLDEEYILAGGELHDTQSLWKSEQRAILDEVAEVEQYIKEQVVMYGPMLLLEKQTEALLEADACEQRMAFEERLASTIERRDAELIDFLHKHTDNPDTLEQVRAFLTLQQFDKDAPCPTYPCPLDLGPQARKWLEDWKEQGAKLHRQRLQNLIARYSELKIERQRLESLLLQVPLEHELTPLAAKRTRLLHAESKAEQEIEDLEKQLEQLDLLCLKAENRFLTRAQSKARESLEIEDLYRILLFSRRVRDALTRFRELLIERRLPQLTALIQDSFTALMRKQTPLDHLLIDPQDWAITVVDAEGATHSPEIFSTGERQLLGHAIQWGIARICARPLPVIIDAPLAHLDSSHRQNLVENYFPHAAPQLILLSTDEEIDQQTLDPLTPYISHTYHLVFDEIQQATTLKTGYFFS